MKLAVVLFAMFAVTLAAFDVYPTKYDTIDIDGIIRNKRLFDNYVQCLLKITPKCNDEGTTLREVIPDALITGCSKCNPIQKASVKKVIKYLRADRPSDWDALIKLYDPKGEYQSQYAALLAEL